MPARRSLRQRLLAGMFGYLLLSSLAVLVYGFVVHEQAEHTLWEALLQAEFDHLQDKMRSDPGYRWVDTETLALYGDAPLPSLPPELAGMRQGLHDELSVGGRETVALLRDVGGQRRALVLDITEMEQRETYLAATMTAAMLVMGLLLGAGIVWGVDRLLRPMRQLSDDIGRLDPDRGGERLAVPADASAELAVIAASLNEYLERNARFVARERDFIDSASHELRTPISVIAGAAELASGQGGMPDPARQQLARIRRTAHEMERLVTLLLVLARDPQRIAAASDRIALDQLLPEIVADHVAMADDKGLVLALGPLPAVEVLAPMPVLQAAVANLLRNAIENSNAGTIAITLDADAVVQIADPGHGMSPEQVSAIYARAARGGAREGAGIGLQLIARLCAHLGWQLDLVSQPERGTVARLDLRAGQPPGV